MRSAPEPPRSVLILKPSSFGDVIHTLPAVARLKAAWPRTRFAWMVNAEWVPLLEGNPDLDEIVVFPRREFRGLVGAWRFLRWQRQHIRERQPDLVLDFQGLLRMAIVGRLSRPRLFYGMSDAREGAVWFYDQASPMLGGTPHAVERYLSLSDFALRRCSGADFTLPETTSIRFPLPRGEPPNAPEADRLGNNYVLLHPFSRGSGKSLSAGQVAEFCRALPPRQVVLVGSGRGGMGHAPPGVLDLLDRTSLRQLIWIVQHAAFVISVDSGPVHLAAALNRPLVAIHAWSDPRQVGPYHPDAWVWKSGQLVRMREIDALNAAFYSGPRSDLSAAQIRTICALATSSSDFFA